MGMQEAPEAVLRLRKCLESVLSLGLVRAFEESLRANGILDLSLANDPAGRKESNLWKLLQKAQELESAERRGLLSRFAH